MATRQKLPGSHLQVMSNGPAQSALGVAALLQTLLLLLGLQLLRHLVQVQQFALVAVGGVLVDALGVELPDHGPETLGVVAGRFGRQDELDASLEGELHLRWIVNCWQEKTAVYET